MTMLDDYNRALERADRVHDQATIEAAITRIGREVTKALAGEPAIFMSVMHGGMIFAGQLATTVDGPLEFDYLHATRYRGTTSGGELLWKRKPTIAMADRTVLLVDDILDEGHTLSAVREFCRSEGASRILLAVLCEKRHGRTVPNLAADFVGVEVPDRYVFGYGMDYHELGRNLPAIYAL
ncbi:MAG: hypoxanthine-guanine phosphoribosyltransferase [Dokdonella sp.]